MVSKRALKCPSPLLQHSIIFGIVRGCKETTPGWDSNCWIYKIRQFTIFKCFGWLLQLTYFRHDRRGSSSGSDSTIKNACGSSLLSSVPRRALFTRFLTRRSLMCSNGAWCTRCTSGRRILPSETWSCVN